MRSSVGHGGDATCRDAQQNCGGRSARWLLAKGPVWLTHAATAARILHPVLVVFEANRRLG
eukprot:2239522-Amphidinium_carterae.2